MSVEIVMVEPEIPQNTGNVIRTCAAVGVRLHLVKPLGFSMDDRYLKRAGLDYFEYSDIKYHESLEEFLYYAKDKLMYLLSTKGEKSCFEVDLTKDCFLLFGKETQGLPKWLVEEKKEFCARIPMKPGIRSLNLSNSVAITLFEALRQSGFVGLC